MIPARSCISHLARRAMRAAVLTPDRTGRYAALADAEEGAQIPVVRNIKHNTLAKLSVENPLAGRELL